MKSPKNPSNLNTRLPQVPCIICKVLIKKGWVINSKWVRECKYLVDTLTKIVYDTLLKKIGSYVWHPRLSWSKLKRRSWIIETGDSRVKELKEFSFTPVTEVEVFPLQFLVHSLTYVLWMVGRWCPKTTTVKGRGGSKESLRTSVVRVWQRRWTSDVIVGRHTFMRPLNQSTLDTEGHNNQFECFKYRLKS